MSDKPEKKPETITTKIWDEVPEEDNPFAAKACYCSGYDVYGDLLGKISWIEYLYLLFKLERPTEQQRKLFEGLAVVLANPGPRDHSVRAAMNAGATGGTHAGALIAALAVGAGNLRGGREVFLALENWNECGFDVDAWESQINEISNEEDIDIWPSMEHFPGFDPHGRSCSQPVLQCLKYLVEVSPNQSLEWLNQNRERLESMTGLPLSIVGVAGAAFYDLGLSAAQSEMAYLLLRLPGAAVHALEQESMGWSRYPFFKDGLKLIDHSSSSEA